VRTAAADALVERLCSLLPAGGDDTDRAALEAEFDHAREQSSAFPVEAWYRALRDFLTVHRRVPRRPARLFSDALHVIKSSPAALSPGRVFVSDKDWVKAWVRLAAGDAFNVPTLAVLRTVEELNAFAFPNRCVVKPTHLSGEVVLRPGGEPLDLGRIASWLTTGYASVSGEVNYLPLTPKVVVEPFVFDETQVDDYKFFCVDGTVRLVQVDQDRATLHRRVLYDADGRSLPFSIHYPRGEERPLPENFAAMKALAEKLSAPFGFIRVDLYSNGLEVKVGELTNCHGGGLEAFGSLEEEVAVSALLFGEGGCGGDGDAHPKEAAMLEGLASSVGLTPGWHRYEAGDDFALLGHLRERLASMESPRVLWLGPPGRSRELAASVRAQGGRWLTVEDEAGALAGAWAGHVPITGEHRVTALVTSEFLGMMPSFYDLSFLTTADVFDLVVVAGPSPFAGSMSRLLALPTLVGHLSPAFCLALCDADEPEARKTLDIWRLLAPHLTASRLCFGRPAAMVRA
jgi:hypothetical protein